MAKRLTPEELKTFRATLVRAQAELTGDMSQLQEEALGPMGGPDSSDTPGDGAEAYYQEFNLELLERDGTALQEVGDALERIEAGTFGACEVCGRAITRARLRALPHTRHCIDCQRALEQLDS